MVLVALVVFAAHLYNDTVISFTASVWSVQFLGSRVWQMIAPVLLSTASLLFHDSDKDVLIKNLYMLACMPKYIFVHYTNIFLKSLSDRCSQIFPVCIKLKQIYMIFKLRQSLKCWRRLISSAIAWYPKQQHLLLLCSPSHAKCLNALLCTHKVVTL